MNVDLHTMVLCFYIILIHYIADFMFQTEKMATNKKNSIVPLLKHTILYSMIMGFGFIFIFPTILQVILFTVLTFCGHTIVDYYTSKITGKLFENKTYYTGLPNFGAFSIIGLDQVIHYLILFLTVKILL